MSKYDFGYQLERGSTNEWAFQMVQENSRVLEIGPAIGNLTSHLVEDKHCLVDIVEIDEEAGKQAAKFAKRSQIGSIDGNLNTDVWYCNLQTEKYDYIISLDVLEHLENPEHVLQNLKRLLKESGKILLSVPNLAHNAVILELLQNDFCYNDLGLLDRTHIHFFAYESMIKMIENVELHIDYIDAIKKSVSDTEIKCSYDGMPVEVEQYLKTRRFADAYQYLVVLGKQKSECINNLKDGIIRQDMCQTKVLVDGLLKNQIVFQNHYDNVSVEVELKEYKGSSSIRLVPVESCALVYELHAYGVSEKGIKKEINYNWTSGIGIDRNCVILSEKASEINYIIDSDIRKIEIFFKCKLLSNIIIQEIQKIEKQKEQYFQIINEKNNEINEKNNEINERNNEINERNNECQEIMIQKNRLNEELTRIKSHICYRIYMKLYRILHRK
jgi:2-polyprenyl-3-methyl-5-hydroxy-6-metoxy-1,4-benzoquinol methylase